jgi:hypothetical protein
LEVNDVKAFCIPSIREERIFDSLGKLSTLGNCLPFRLRSYIVSFLNERFEDFSSSKFLLFLSKPYSYRIQNSASHLLGIYLKSVKDIHKPVFLLSHIHKALDHTSLVSSFSSSSVLPILQSNLLTCISTILIQKGGFYSCYSNERMRMKDILHKLLRIIDVIVRESCPLTLPQLFRSCYNVVEGIIWHDFLRFLVDPCLLFSILSKYVFCDELNLVFESLESVHRIAVHFEVREDEDIQLFVFDG